MAWIEVHQTLPTHRKIKKLKRLLKIKTPQAVGHMVILWLWAIDNAPDGRLDSIDPEDIAEAAEWTGDAERFVSALVDSGFVDNEDHLSIHDWDQFAGFLADKRETKKQQNRERQKRYRERAKSASASLDNSSQVTHSNEDVTRYDRVTQALHNAPNLTLPNLTLPNNGNGSNTSDDSNARSVMPPPPKSRAVDAYMSSISPTPSAASMMELLEFEEDMGADVCIRAIDKALDANARNWNYIKAILTSCKEQGVKSMQDWDRLEEQRRDAKHRKVDKSESSNPFLEIAREEAEKKYGQA